MSLTLFLSKALLCTSMQCWPVLIGTATPVGEYSLQQRLTDDPGYGGDVLQFHETQNSVFAIHRVWTLRANETRSKRLKNPNPLARVITKGCVNVDPAVYDYLIANFRTATLRIEP